MNHHANLSPEDTDRVIEMAWEDRTPFDAIYRQFELPEKDVIKLMRRELKESSFQMWRKRVQNRSTKHQKRNQSKGSVRFKSTRQKSISNNQIT
ncbi:TIGR03643 family protein [Cyclobacterium jeungdonense]|uniref:TIGR03643 family protein n=1 Tax=Cyclobacterium jeungdonense TaxID=708087 RepID=A0ABT8C999_9BACT|nr:TIGR03643 family protein [Cyclobacterium jeungdonense]MDN3688941.1 TIGR03643 family protein [Cyclobacterium jeungdonense]